MNLIIPLADITEEDRRHVGGKAFSLAAMARKGMNVPDALCVKADAYKQFIAVAGLKERILLELNRKNAQDMRWEEMWDTSLRIRNMFLNTPLPVALSTALGPHIQERFQDKRVVVRSSAPGEDSSRSSFAGLHESYVNVWGTEAILEHIKRVWASLWSYGALLYRQELGLDFEHSRMAVVVQEIVRGDRSGVVFGKNPNVQVEIEKFLEGLEAVEAVIETGRSSYTIVEVLEEIGVEVKIAHPNEVKAIARAKIKTDRRDSEVLAHLLRMKMIPEVYPRSQENRQAQRVLR